MSTASVLSTIGGSLISALGQMWSNKKNLQQQANNNDIAIQLANTSHQREVADLEAAGLNPILSANGSGASTPSLGVATQVNPTSDIASSSKQVARYLSDEYAQNVESVRLSNQFQDIVNSATKEESAAIIARAQAERLMAEAELEAVNEELGYKRNKDGHGVEFDSNQWYKSQELLRQGVRSDMKLRSNANWRANMSSFAPFTAPISSAASSQAAKSIIPKLIK